MSLDPSDKDRGHASMDHPQTLVRAGYDAIGNRYLAAAAGDSSSPRMRYVTKLLARLHPGNRVLDLGCGPGYPATQALATSCRVVAVDLSAAQLALARRHAPTATLLQADMSQLDLAPESFDAVAALYSLTHVPRARHALVLGRVARWLRPGGYLLVTMGAGDAADSLEEGWLGAPMFFSHFDASTNVDLVKGAGFIVEEAAVVREMEHDGREVQFLWVIGRKPTPTAAAI